MIKQATERRKRAAEQWRKETWKHGEAVSRKEKKRVGEQERIEELGNTVKQAAERRK